MLRPLTILALAAGLLPVASGDAPLAFEATGECVLAQTMPAPQDCSAAHSGTAGEPFCFYSDWSWREWCGFPWTINATFTGPNGLVKRIMVWQEWEGSGGGTSQCASYWSTAPAIHCDHASLGGALAPIPPGECDVMRLTTLGDMPPPYWVEYWAYPTWHAEAVTRIELCRNDTGTPTVRLLE